MSLDKFFVKDPAEAWAEELQRRAEEAKAKEEAERQQRIAELQARRGKKGKEPAAAATPPAAVLPILPAGNFKIESLADRYRIHQVQYQNGLYVVDLRKELLDEGKSHTQQEWINLTQNTEWKLADMQLYHATLAALYRQREHPVQAQKDIVAELHRLFKADFDPAKPYMSTSTRIKYAASGKDEVTHEWGYASARKKAVALVGPDTLINPSSGLEEQMDVLLGSRDLAEIENVYEWISGKKPYLLRFNQSPARDEERAAVLGSDVSRFSIVCIDDLDNGRPALGWSSSREEISGGSS